MNTHQGVSVTVPTLEPVGHADTASTSLPMLDAAAVLQGGNRAQIHFRGETYLLSVTRLGKLILTK